MIEFDLTGDMIQSAYFGIFVLICMVVLSWAAVASFVFGLGWAVNKLDARFGTSSETDRRRPGSARG